MKYMLCYVYILGCISVNVFCEKNVNLQLETVVEFDPNEEEEDLKLIGNLENILQSVKNSMTKRPFYMKNYARSNDSVFENFISGNYNFTDPITINVVGNQKHSMTDKQTIETIDSIIKKDKNTIRNKNNDYDGAWRRIYNEDKWKPDLKHIAKLVHRLDDNDLQTLVETVDNEVRRQLTRAEHLEINQTMIRGLDYLKSIPKSAIREFLKKNAENAKLPSPESSYKNSHLFQKLSNIFKRINSVFHFIDVPAERQDLNDEQKMLALAPNIGSDSEEKLSEPSHSQEVKFHQKYFKDVVKNAIKGILDDGIQSNPNLKQRKDVKAKLKRLWQNLNKKDELLIEKKSPLKEGSKDDQKMQWLKLFQNPEDSKKLREYNIQHSIYNNIGSLQGLSNPRLPARHEIVEIEDYIDEIRQIRSTPKIKHYHIHGQNNQLTIKNSIPMLNKIKMASDAPRKDKNDIDKKMLVLLHDLKDKGKTKVKLMKQNKKRESKLQKKNINKDIKQQIKDLKSSDSKLKVNKTKKAVKSPNKKRHHNQEKNKKQKAKTSDLKAKKNVHRNKKSQSIKKFEKHGKIPKHTVTMTTAKELQGSPATVDFFRPGHYVKHDATISVIRRPKGKYLSYWAPQNGTWVQKLKSVSSEETGSSSELNLKTEDRTNEGMSIELSNFQNELIKILQKNDNQNENGTTRRKEPTKIPKYPLAYEKLIGQYEYTTHDSLRRKILENNKTPQLAPQIVQRIDHLEKKFKNLENFIKDINSSSTETQKNIDFRAWGFNKCPLITKTSQAITKRSSLDTKPETTLISTFPSTIPVSKTTKTLKDSKQDTDNEITTSEVTKIINLTKEIPLKIERSYNTSALKTTTTVITKNITANNTVEVNTLMPKTAAPVEDKLKLNNTKTIDTTTANSTHDNYDTYDYKL